MYFHIISGITMVEGSKQYTSANSSSTGLRIKNYWDVAVINFFYIFLYLRGI